MNHKPFLASALFVTLLSLIVSCKKDDSSAGGSGDDNNDSNGSDTTYVTNTRDTIFTNAVLIKFNGSSATVTNPFEGAGVTATVTNANVVITSTLTSTEVNYVLSGLTTDGSLKMYSDYKFNLVLNGVAIANNDGPAINIQSGKKISVMVLDSTNNRLIDGSTYATSTEDQKGTLFSEGQLVFSRNGNLTVTGNYKHAICSDDYISITSSNIKVVSAVSDGIHANDYINIEGGTLNVTANGDGVECEEGYITLKGGGITVNSVDDGIVASYNGTDAAITPYIKITGGSINVTTSGEKANAISSEGYTSVNSSGTLTLAVSGQGSKGFKTGGDFSFAAGTAVVTNTANAFYDTDDAAIASPAGINCDGALTITGGIITINNSGKAGKGITVDGTVTVSGGTIAITASGATYIASGDTSEAKGFKSDGAMLITGGEISVAATDDGIKSETSVTVNGGIINIKKSTEGIEAPYITLAGGTINVVASDDCLNATMGNGGESNDGSLLTLSGAIVTLNTTGGDGIDSNGSIVMTGGTVVAQGPPSQPEVGLDYNGTFLISGGVLVVSGPNSGNMIQGTSTGSGQYTVLVKLSSGLSAGTLFTIQNSSGTNLMTFSPVRSAYYVVFSSAELLSGSTYKVFTGGSISGSTNTGGLHTGGTYTGGTQKGTFTVSSKLTTVTM